MREHLETGAQITAEERARLLPSLSTRAQLLEVEALGIRAARAWAMRPAVLAGGSILSEAFCQGLHRRMFGSLWRGAGRYRAGDARDGWEPARIPEGMRIILDDAEGWIRYSTYPVHAAAVRLHHRMATIRPWSVGSHRHARLLADVLVASLGEAPLGWGRTAADPRRHYEEAVRLADGGDMGPLLEFARD
ncbi:MAG TPA: mobile mystery protein B [Opitutaceae bacterium]|jgi:Fic-DOC domain mobile mystery protein B